MVSGLLSSSPYFLVHLSTVDIDAADPEDNISTSVNTCQKTDLSPRRISEHRRLYQGRESEKTRSGCAAERPNFNLSSVLFTIAHCKTSLLNAVGVRVGVHAILVRAFSLPSTGKPARD